MLRALAAYTEMLGRPVLCGVLKSVGDPAAAPARRRSTFEYVRSWLEHRDAYPIEPLRLPLARGPYPSPDGEQVQGIFRDAVPDSWGQRVIEKTFPRYRRSEEHTSELQSLMRISYAVFCLKKQQKDNKRTS